MKFLSVCSGIEAASVAWNPLGWEAVAFSEIEPFPCAVLAHHYPNVPNLGDMTKYKDWPDYAIDLLCGGTPCQSFSVAGLRKGLDDPRGNLMLTFGAIAAKYRPQWLVWENVPGVLSSNGGRDFGAFLGMLGQLGYGFAYRVLDAQYFGVAQRRRRVFVVACLGDWRSAAAVLFERHSLQGHPAPSREAGQAVARGVEIGTAGGRFTDLNPTLDARAKDGPVRNQLEGAVLQEVGTLCVSTGQAGAEIGAEIGADMAPTLNCNHEAPYIAHTLRGEGFDASEDGTGRGTPLVPVIGWDNDLNASTEQMGTLLKGGDGGRHEGVMVPVAFDTTQITSAANRSNPQAGDPCHPLAAGAHAPSIAYTTKLHNTQSNQAGKVYEEYATSLDRSSPPPALLTAMQVRRLTPVECERLQGFPDGYTAIPWRKKPASECPDGPRYKALGNSWATTNARWIGERINAVARMNIAQKAMNSVAESA